MNRFAPASLGKQARKQSGVAAIEFVIVFPMLVLLLIYTVNFTQYIAHWRRLSITANLVADVVSRRQSPLSAADVENAYQAGRLAVRPQDPATMGVDVYNLFRAANGAIAPRWRQSYSGGTIQPNAICPAPDMTGAGPIGGVIRTEDLIVVAVCMPFAPIVNAYGVNQLMNFAPTPHQQVAVRPRLVTVLNCTDCI